LKTLKIDAENCLLRDGDGKCLKCYDNYFLNQSSQCKSKVLIENCEEH